MVMSVPWDVGTNRDLPRGLLTSHAVPGGEVPIVTMPGDLPSKAIDAVDVALARQELLAAANASNPLGQAIIRHLVVSIIGRAKKGNTKASGGALPPER